VRARLILTVDLKRSTVVRFIHPFAVNNVKLM
jgi:hypothetical protein